MNSPEPTHQPDPTRRVLTTDDLHVIQDAAEAAENTGHLLRTAVTALYTALRDRPDHLSQDERPSPAQLIRPGDYAIPSSQWQAILAVITGRAQAWGTAAEVGLELALNLMPSHYDDPDVPEPDLPLPDHRPTEHRVTFTRDAIDVITACQTHLQRLRDHYHPTSATYRIAADSWHDRLAGLLSANTGADTHVNSYGNLGLLVRTSSGLFYALVFHADPRHCTTTECGALIDDDATPRAARTSTVLDHDHTPSYPVGAPTPGHWSLHS
jgi:hypothetical protein